MSNSKQKKIFKDVKSFVVKRRRWARGGKKGKSKLLNTSNNMCCLGFYARACGIPAKDIEGMGTPLAVLLDHQGPDVFSWETKLISRGRSNSRICGSLMQINDVDHIDDVEREKQLKKLFHQMGVKVKFE